MTTRLIGARIPRNEDPRLLRGLGSFVDDIEPRGVLHAACLRSPHAHARITAIDATRARALPGVHLVLTAADLGELNQPSPLLIPHPGLTHPRTQRPLAVDEVRYAGELVAFVVAEDRYVAEDAVGLMDVAYEALPVVADFRTATQPGGPLVHADVPGNRAARVVQRVGDPDTAFKGAARVLSEQLYIERSCGSPIEARGVVAEHDARTGQLRVWSSTQAPLPIKNGLARIFGLPEFKVEVVAPDTGGGFGTKIMLFYPEEILVPYAAMHLGRPVKWTEDRLEHFVSASHERGQLHEVEVACDADGRILGLRDRFRHDAGAYTPYGIVIPLITSTQLPGQYRIRHYQVEFDVLYTNKVMTTPYRGAGRPHGAFVMERVIGLIARELGLEPAEVRRRNLIQPDEFPWDVGLTFQDGGPTRYDSGNYPAGLEMALDAVGARDFRARQVAARAEGRYLGLGVACYVEGTGIGPYEGAHVRVEPSGRVFVATGLTSQGQGHQTTFAQIAAEALGCSPADVTVVTGDTGRFNWGAGTFASRALVTSGNAVAVAAGKVRDKALQLAAELLEASAGDIELVEGAARVKGVPGRQLTLGALATVANPIRYAYGKEAAEAALRLVKPRQGAVLREGEEPGLEARGYYAPPQATFASGCHAAIVEVDVETGEVRFEKYVVQHDCGVMVNPTVVEGQIHGGVAQGIGGALYEKLAYDDHGQLLAGSFMDFLMPTSAEIPDITIVHLETPSPLNPLGVKGVGEAGAIPVPALVAEAVDDALAALRRAGARDAALPDPDPRADRAKRGQALTLISRDLRSQRQSPGLTPLWAVRVSRCVREWLHAGGRAVVLGVQRRACQLAVEDGPLLMLSTPEVPLAPNALAVDVQPDITLRDAGFRAGQAVDLGSGLDFETARSRRRAGVVWQSRPDPADWVVALGRASTWEPRPRVHRLAPEDLADRVRTARAMVVAEGTRESLLPVLWASESDVSWLRPGLIRAAGVSAQLLTDAAVRRDERSVARAARGLAGLGPGLTPSGDDLLAGFAAAWTLLGESLGVDDVARRQVTQALVAGAERGASPLGQAWLGHACRGELLEPMTRFVAALLAAEPRDLDAVARGALAVGSSSGTDWMVGFLLGASAVLDGMTVARPW